MPGTADIVPPNSVLIIGAGLVGLTLAQALKVRGIPFQIFDRDAAVDSRTTGWGITIHWGLPIFKSLLPLAVLDSVDRAGVNPAAEAAGEKGAAAFYDYQTGVARFKTPAAERRRLRRDVLRQVLTDGIDIQWSKRIVGVNVRDGQSVEASFDDGASATGSLLVGCDGAHSRVREILAPGRTALTQLPCRFLGAMVVLPAAAAQGMRNLDPYFLQGGDPSSDVFMYFSFLDTPSNNNRADKDSYTCQIVISWPFRPPELPDVPATAAERVKLMKALTRNWAEPFSSVVAAMPDDTQPTAVKLEDWSPSVESDARDGSAPPVSWDNLGGFATLAGDAAHTMTMYRGEAFNHGIRDVETLVTAIEPVLTQRGKEPSGLSEHLQKAISTYEAEVGERGNAAVLASRRACLDAHDQRMVDANSPLVNRRVMVSAAEADPSRLAART